MACRLHAPLYNSTRIIIFPCAGNAGSFRCDRGDYARVLFYFACEAAGASSARHSLRPLISEDGTFLANLARNVRRDREAVFTIESATYPIVVAREGGRSSIPRSW